MLVITAALRGCPAVRVGDGAGAVDPTRARGRPPANTTGAGRVGGAGPREQRAAFAAAPPARARLRPLPVAGAFHTRHMAPAVDALREAAATLAVHSPVLMLLSNPDGSVLRGGTDRLERVAPPPRPPPHLSPCTH